MTKRYPIRDKRSKTNIRLFDILLYDDGKMEVELKNKNGTKTVPLEDIRIQIKEIETRI